METKHIDLPKLLGSPLYNAPAPKLLEYTDWYSQDEELIVVRHERTLLGNNRRVSQYGSRAVAWDLCWKHCLEKYKAGDNNLTSLLPPFLASPEQPLRYFGKYISPRSQGLLYTVQKTILSHLIMKWGRGSVLAEFGCGSGYNLALAKDLQNSEYSTQCGFDWSPAAIECVRALGFAGDTFDMNAPSQGLDGSLLSCLPWASTTVLTAGAMEQLGENCWPFVKFLLDKKPTMCIHVEPLIELYDRGNLFDDEAARYHTARGYLVGFQRIIQQLASIDKAVLYEVHRTHFGGRFNDGFSWVVWRPL